MFNFRIFSTLAILAGMILTPAANAADILTADFDAGIPLFWSRINNSTPNPDRDWRTASNGAFTAQSTTGYAYANFESVANTPGTPQTISNWLLTPQIALSNGTQISFWTRTETGATRFNDLFVRFSTAGASTNVGADAGDLGDFQNLLIGVNTGGTNSSYPTDWTQFTVTINGLPTATTGRIGFHYFVPNGGQGGFNSSIVGLDTVRVTGVPVTVPEMGAGVLFVVAGVGLAALRRFRRK